MSSHSFLTPLYLSSLFLHPYPHLNPFPTRSLLHKLCCPEVLSRSNTYCCGSASPPSTRSWIPGSTSCAEEPCLKESPPASTGLAAPSCLWPHLLATPSEGLPAHHYGAPWTRKPQETGGNLTSHLLLRDYLDLGFAASCCCGNWRWQCFQALWPKYQYCDQNTKQNMNNL